MREFEGTAFAFDRACRAGRASYCFVGGMAVVAWGQPRTTSDVDALVDLPGDVAAFVSALRAEGLTASEEDFRDSLADGSHVTVFDDQGPFHVDVKLVRKEDERRQVERAVELVVGDGRVRVASAEDTVAYKLLFASPQDVADARSIVARQGGRFDVARARVMARQLGVEDALDDLLASSKRDWSP